MPKPRKATVGCSDMLLSQCKYLNQFGRTARCTQRILQRPAVTLRGNLHHVAVLQANTVAETQAIGAEEVNVNISAPAMRFVFEMMVLDVLQVVAHFGFAAEKSSALFEI